MTTPTCLYQDSKGFPGLEVPRVPKSLYRSTVTSSSNAVLLSSSRRPPVVLTCCIVKELSCRESAKADLYRRSSCQLTSCLRQDTAAYISVRDPKPISDIIEQKLLRVYSLQDKESSYYSLLDQCVYRQVQGATISLTIQPFFLILNILTIYL
jgi:hypothetical protein